MKLLRNIYIIWNNILLFLWKCFSRNSKATITINDQLAQIGDTLTVKINNLNGKTEEFKLIVRKTSAFQGVNNIAIYDFNPLIDGASGVNKELCDLIMDICPYNINVLIHLEYLIFFKDDIIP